MQIQIELKLNQFITDSIPMFYVLIRIISCQANMATTLTKMLIKWIHVRVKLEHFIYPLHKIVAIFH